MVLDYSERKPVSKNRARKQPVGMFVIILVSAVSMSFALGLLSGWMLFKPARRGIIGHSSISADGAKGATPASLPTVPLQNPETAASRSAEPPLTFYETLPKGGKAVIGSGLNPKKSDVSPVAKPAVVAPQLPEHAVPQPVAAPVPASAAPAATARTEEHKLQNPAVEQPKKSTSAAPLSTKKQDDPTAKYCVQIASLQDRREADIIRTKMAGKGLPVYVVESKIKDKGTWYRVRAGKHLTQQAAGELAAKAGKGALVIPE